MREELIQAIVAACSELFSVDVQVELTRPDEQFGDYATNVALQLAGKVASPPYSGPRQIAEALQAGLVAALANKSEVTIAGPGFLNFRLSDRALIGALNAMPKQTLVGQTYLVEYSDPNPFKPLHAGHLYTTLVGNSIARLVEHAGAKTVRINYGGDVGLHVARSMWAIVRSLGGELPDKLADIPENERPAWLGARYVEGTSADEDDPKAHAEIVAMNKRVYQIHTENDRVSPFAQLYWTCRQWSYDYFAELYRQLRVDPFDRYIPESEVTPLGMKAVLEHTLNAPENKTGADVFHYATAGDDSKTVIFQGEKYGLHTRVFINSHGIPTYETKDVGLSLTKWKDYKQFDKSIIITANEQEQYMQVVIAAIMQFEPEPAKRTQHLTHGVVKLQGGVKMSSRKGNVLTAIDLLDAARAAGAETGTDPSEETILAAVKYAFAKNRIGGDIIYDPKESIALEGNSGPYLQYAHARARSILAKSKIEKAAIEDLEPAERSLVRKITEYPEVVEKATAELLPHYICTYLYELAQAFNSFYEHNRVIGDPREAVRLALVEQYVDTLKAGLELLGITAPDKM